MAYTVIHGESLFALQYESADQFQEVLDFIEEGTYGGMNHVAITQNQDGTFQFDYGYPYGPTVANIGDWVLLGSYNSYDGTRTATIVTDHEFQHRYLGVL